MKEINIQIDDETFYAIVWALIIAGIVSVAGIVCYHDIASKKAAFTAGYQEVQKVGSQDTVWQKAKQ